MALTREQMAARAALELHDGAYVNLGIGLPTTVSDYLPTDREIILHTENGMLGTGPVARGDQIGYDLINAGKFPVTSSPVPPISSRRIRSGCCAAVISTSVCWVRSRFRPPGIWRTGTRAAWMRFRPSAARWTWRSVRSRSMSPWICSPETGSASSLTSAVFR